MSNKELSKDESLTLIAEMIGQAKRNVAKGGSFYFLLWGWVVMVANLGHYLIAKFQWYEHPYIVWLLVIPASIVSMVHGARRSKNSPVKSHLDGLYGQIWLAVFIGIMVIIFFMAEAGNLNAIILTFAGIGTYISGQALRFTPLIMGGVALWVASIVAFNLDPIDQYLVGTVGILAGYLIPGYLLRKAEK
ncbi:hypothetical protein [Ekhidna sp.]|uniref:hypothetical protein n=1 Tax=Ekhidna sp. TaxID=2608089 RepID=UPI003CCB88F8